MNPFRIAESQAMHRKGDRLVFSPNGTTTFAKLRLSCKTCAISNSGGNGTPFSQMRDCTRRELSTVVVLETGVSVLAIYSPPPKNSEHIF
jgi:hypothetical protein